MRWLTRLAVSTVCAVAVLGLPRRRPDQGEHADRPASTSPSPTRIERLVPDLAQEDFEIYDNGKLQTLTTFDNEPTPITVVVMLDTSGSMTLALDRVKQGAEAVHHAPAA